MSTGPVALHLGDAKAILPTLPDCSVHSIVTDPPYELGFMGKSWDASGIANDVGLWRECLRVLKPGGHLLAFGGSRTYHRMASAIEDAGFEIRDQIMYLYGSGFPKSFNLDRERGHAFCGCAESDNQVCGMPNGADDAARLGEASEISDLQSRVQRQATQQGTGEALQQRPGGVDGSKQGELPRENERAEESSLEGRSDTPETTRQLRSGEVRPCPEMGKADGQEGRLRDGAPTGHGQADRENLAPRGDSASPRPQAVEQRPLELRALAGQPQSQAGGVWPVCGRCLLPRIPRGLGTALKPAHEPIVVARKPLIGTVAENVQKYGTGALNIDGCRVGESAEGRWPANVIHDGSEEVLSAFPDAPGQSGVVTGYEPSSKTNNVYGHFDGRPATQPRGDSGSAARFFYCAKASRKDRNEGLTDPGPQFSHGTTLRKVEQTETRGNTHPTVKPTELMRYLCRLVTPPDGVVLDPFMGSGSTGKAAVLEGFRFVGIEREADYFEIAKARIGHVGGVASAEAVTKVERPKQEEPQPDLFSFNAV